MISAKRNVIASIDPEIKIIIVGFVSTILAVTKLPAPAMHFGFFVYIREFSRSCRPCSSIRSMLKEAKMRKKNYHRLKIEQSKYFLTQSLIILCRMNAS